MAPDLNFKKCCIEHDDDYDSAVISRLDADKKLGRCITKRGWWAFIVVPLIYFIAVHLFGSKFYKG